MNNTDAHNIVETTLVPHAAFEEATRRIEQCFRHSKEASEPICIALVGESRTGKSRALEECYINHPKIRTQEGLEVPILNVATPSKPTVKGLAEVMLYEMGDPKYSVGTQYNKTIRLRTLIKNAKTRMVMIDEFQHFYDKVSHKVVVEVADWLKILVDDCRVALVVAGLPSCQAVLEQNVQLVGRFLSPIFMPRFDWQNDGQREEFIAILGAFHESLAKQFDLPELDQPNMAFRCYCGTSGIIGYLTKFLRQAVWNALDMNAKSITLEDLQIAHNQAVWTKENSMSLSSPFSREFNTMPTAELLAEIQNIGTAVKETVKPRKTNRKIGRHITASSALVGS